jgi:hypothetical protein
MPIRQPMVLLTMSIISALRPGTTEYCSISMPIPNMVEISKEERMAKCLSFGNVNCFDIPTIIRKQSTANMVACATESKEKRSQIETEGMEAEGSSVVSKITAAHSIVNRL